MLLLAVALGACSQSGGPSLGAEAGTTTSPPSPTVANDDEDALQPQDRGVLVPPGEPEEAPWESHPEVSVSGINARFVESFEQADVNKDGCRPMGIETSSWLPGEDQQGFVFHMATMDGSALYGLEDAYFTDGSVVQLNTWRDAGDPEQLRVHIPTDDPSTFCTYVFGPIGPNNPLDLVLDSLRWIEGG